MDEAIEETTTKKEALDKYVESNITHTTDTQNVHDSAINTQLRDIYKKIKDESPLIVHDNNRIRNEIDGHITKYLGRHSEKGDRAKYALNEMTHYNVSIQDTEDKLVNAIWLRSNTFNNLKNKELIRDAIIDSFVDMSKQSGSVVCNSGRCTRLVGSLTLLDSDDEISHGFLTVEQIRNDAMTKSNDILKETIQEYKNSDDKLLAEVAESYDSTKIINTNVEKEQEFKDLVLQKIKTELDVEYKKKLSDKDYIKIEEHCISAIESI